MKKAPSSIYRLQLNEDFPLRKATKLLPYLKELGVEGVYCSPYFAAFSPHGYDIIDPNQVNPQIASKEDFNAFCKELKRLDLFHIADIVPNHMGIQGNNLWWQDVLLKGKKSKYASFFDINWAQEKILVPLLGMPYEEALKKKQLTIIKKEGKLFAKYGKLLFPVNGKTLPKTINEIDHLLQKQHYQLVDWKAAAQKTSYRRFFNIGDLIGLRIEDSKVLNAHHKWIFQLLKEGKVDGLRVDHPDGLYDPEQYFNRLRKKTKNLIVVEKILGWEEELPSNWKVDGTVGYEFLNMLTGLFVKRGEKLTQIANRFTGQSDDFAQILYKNKMFYMATEMADDIKFLADKLYAFTSKMRAFADLPKGDILNALYELLAAFPVYRSYIDKTGKMLPRDKPYWQRTFDLAQKRNREIGRRVFDFLQSVIYGKLKSLDLTDFVLRFQQLSAPIMAKGFEDITLYQYNRLICCNEVGSDPDRGGVSPDEFHTFCKRKREKWPLGLVATSTHDTKRSMDVRMQIACISEIPEKWEKMVHKWAKENLMHKTEIEGTLFPERNAEYALYQTLLGIWPELPSFARLWPVFQKSVREARSYTSWRHPNLPYEKACKAFLKALLQKQSSFLHSFTPFQKEIQERGEWKSLSSTALQLGAPGIVDIYQGSENFSYNLVDPDNRRSIDYKKLNTLKVDLTKAALHFRRAHKDLFLKGKYIPIKTDEQTIAYLRWYKDQVLLVAAPLQHMSYSPSTLTLPKDFGEGTHLFSRGSIFGRTIKTSSLFQNAPFAWVFWSGVK